MLTQTISAAGLQQNLGRKSLPTRLRVRLPIELTHGIWSPKFYRSGRFCHYEYATRNNDNGPAAKADRGA